MNGLSSNLAEVTLGAALDMPFSKSGRDTTQLLESDVVGSRAIGDEYGTSKIYIALEHRDV